jgi:uncharacterized protein with HEPN domain
VKDRVYLTHILECISQVEGYVRGGRDEFLARRIIQDAVLRNLQVMAESSQRLTESLKASHPEVDWRGIAGLRNVLVHDYLGLNLDEVWAIIERFLPDLRDRVRSIADEADKGKSAS